MFVLRPMDPMAACALDHDVVIPRVEGFCSNGMRGVQRIVMAGHAHFDRGCLLEQEHIIRGMGRMAGGALAVFYRRVFCWRTFLLLHGIGMTTAAQVGHLGLQKLFYRACMGSVAMDTACFIRHGPMDPVLAECLIDHRAMASPAQLVPRLFGRKRIRGRWILMALIAHLIGNRLVNVRVEHPSSIRTMRIMTARAARFRDGIVHVLFLERRRSRLVALQAESRHLVL